MGLRYILVLSIIVLIALSATAISYQQKAMVPLNERPKYAERVILLSIDAMRADMTFQLAEEGKLPGFKYLIDHGVVAKGMIVSFPSATAVSHAVLSTGAPPGITGITGNSFHEPGMKVYETKTGFSGAYLRAEPIWVTADKQGLKAIVAAFPQSTPSAWEGKVSKADLFNPYDAFLWPVSYSKLYTTNTSISAATVISFTPAANWSNTGVVGSVVEAYEANIIMGDDIWYLYLAELDGDGYPDKLAIVPGEKDLSKALTILSEGEWSKPLNTTITYNGNTYVVAPLFKAINLSLNNFRLYRSLMRPFNASWFNNETLAWNVWNNVVVKTGMITDGDWYALVNEWIDPDTYMETVNFTNNFFKEFTLYLIKHTNWELLLAYTPIVDNVYHEFLGLIDPSMPYYDPDKASVYRNYVEEAMMWADSILKAIIDNVDLDNTVVIVVSDHGQWSVKKFVNINSILYQAGLIAVNGDGSIDWNNTKAYYVGYNQIFVNLQGREEDGVVPPDEYGVVVNKIMDALASVRDPDTGEPVFSLILSKDEAEPYGLFGDRAGDVIFSCRPGYAASTSLQLSNGTPVLFSDAVPLKTVTGTHGDYPYYPQLIAIFGAVGPNIIHGELGYIRSTSIAPTITTILGIEPPANATGNPLPILEPLVETTTETIVSVSTSTETITQTTTIEETITKEITTTKSLPVTITSTTMVPTTTTETKLLKQTITYTTTTTTKTEVPVTDWGTTAIIGIILLIIGLAIGYVLKKPR